MLLHILFMWEIYENFVIVYRPLPTYWNKNILNFGNFLRQEFEFINPRQIRDQLIYSLNLIMITSLWKQWRFVFYESWYKFFEINRLRTVANHVAEYQKLGRYSQRRKNRMSLPSMRSPKEHKHHSFFKKIPSANGSTDLLLGASWCTPVQI